jgi:class 3 adenylate cyclase/predicted ATPase
MTCPTCGSVNEAGRKFCGECGTRLATVCATCGTSNAPGARFCGECGSGLEAGAEPAAAIRPGARPAALPAAPGGNSRADAGATERRLVTVLFADLVSFTSLAEGRDHEEVRDLLSRYADAAREVIERYGGTVEKFIGDAVMAVWGAPTAHEDDAERAVRAGLDVVAMVGGIDPALQARAGVLTGEATVTLAARGQGLVAGDLVNTAARLQSVATPGTVLVGEATQRAAAGAIAFEPAGDQALKGKEAPVPSWRALRVVGERGGRGRGDRLEAPFVGRDPELRLMKDLFHATARERRVRLVSITGQAGIGKSRLAWEFLKYVDGVVEKVWWHEGRSPSYGEGITFWALGEMVRSRCGLLETDDDATTRAKIAAKVAEFVHDEAERRRIEPALLALLGVGDAPAGGAGELFGAWRLFFERMANERMVALLFEDLHWADPGLLDFIDHILEWSRNVPILIITLARPELLERRSDWGAGRRNFLALDLEPLQEDAMRDLLTGLVPDLPEVAVRSIVARAEGIPLYAVETIRMLAADGRLAPDDAGGFRTVGELGTLSVPESLHALIAARLDGLEPTERALVQDAAVLGQSFTLAGLSAVAGKPPEALELTLRALVRADLLRQEVDPRSPERGQYAFVQALIREVAYSTVSLRDRRTRHLAAARFFESLGEEELAGALAAHYLAAFRASPAGPEADALAAQARVSLRAAAERAASLGAPRQAVTFLEQAMEVASDDADLAELLERATLVAHDAADYERATRLVEQLEAVRERLPDRSALALAVTLRAEGLYRARQRDQARTLLREALDRFADLGEEDPSVLRMLANLAVAMAFTRQYDEAGAMSDRALAIAERIGDPITATRMLTIKGTMAMFQGRLWEAIALTEGARRVAEQHNLREEVLRANNALANIIALDDPRATAQVERETIELARRLGKREMEIITIGNTAEDVRRTGDWDWVYAELERAVSDEAGVTELLLDSALAAFQAERGELSEPEFEALRARLASLEDIDVGSAEHDIRAILLRNAGDYAGAADSWLTFADASDLNAPYSLPKAGTAAVLGGDAERAQLVLDRLGALGTRGRAIDADRAVIRAGLAAIAGDGPVALAGYRAAKAAHHELGLAWDEALDAVSAGLRLGAANEEVRGWLEDALLTFRRLRVKPLGGLVEALLAGGAGPDRASRGGARSAEHSVAERASS